MAGAGFFFFEMQTMKTVIFREITIGSRFSYQGGEYERVGEDFAVLVDQLPASELNQKWFPNSEFVQIPDSAAAETPAIAPSAPASGGE